MYEIQHDAFTADNFYRGSFPALTEVGTVKSGAKVEARMPVIKTKDGIEPVAAETLDQLVGITASAPSGGEVTYYLTGEFWESGINLPQGVELDALKAACRKLSIFLCN